MFCNLKTRSYYSMSRSSISIDDIIVHAHDRKMDCACLVDIDVMYGALEFYTKAVAANLKPILGLSTKIDNQEYIFIAKNYQGYLKLCVLSSAINHQEKFKVEDFASDDIVLISQFKAPGFKNYYQPDDLAIHEALFANKDDYKKFKALIAINKGILYDEVEDDQEIADKYLYDEAQAQAIFSKQQLDNTSKLLDSINLKIDLNTQNHFVQFSNKHKAYDLLQERCRQGLIKRFGEKVEKKYIDRIKYELDIIHKMGFDDYFLVVQDYVAFAKQKNIAVGPGRGSAAGSLVSYVLQITDIDPLQYGLIFERFLNSHRQTKPDIDIDFMDNRRQEIIDYLFTKYGKDRVAHIITFQKIKIKTAIRDIARILDIDLKIVNLICKSISDWFDTDIEATVKEKKVIADYEAKYPQLFELAKFIMGAPRQIGTHAAGIVICNKPLQEVIPTTLSAEGLNTTQYSMEWIEPTGLIKMDILGLVNLSIINDCVDEINKHATKKFDIEKIPLDDLKVFKQLCAGNTLGIFQLESPGMTRVIQKIQPKSIEDISIASALFRPGPQANIPTYVANKKKPDSIEYIDDRLTPVIAPTYGIIIYQEQVIQTVCLVANWSLAEADIFRRAISKKQFDKIAKIKADFIKAAINNNYTEAKANQIFDYLIKFASYGFNHSHSIAYALIAYQMAYLKTYYPLQFYTCLLTYNPVAKINIYLQEAKANGITILPPDINHSDVGFSIYKNNIIFGFAPIKGIGGETVSKILTARAKAKSWDNFEDCLKDLIANGVGESALQLLIKAGCFDCFFNKQIPNRASILASLSDVYQAIKTYTPKYGYLKSITYTTIEENKETKKKENDEQFGLLGISFTAHPIVEIKENNAELMKDVFNLNYIINEGQMRQPYKTLIYVSKIRLIKTKTGLNMAFVSCEDETRSLTDAVTFNSILDNPQQRLMFQTNKYLLVEVVKSSKSIKINKVLKEVA